MTDVHLFIVPWLTGPTCLFIERQRGVGGSSEAAIVRDTRSDLIDMRHKRGEGGREDAGREDGGGGGRAPLVIV